MTTASKAYIGRTDPSDPGTIAARMREAFEHIEIGRFLSSSTRVFLKPNLTYPRYNPGVTTSPAFVEAAVALLREWTAHITIVESNGGAHAWQAEEAFEGHGFAELVRRYGVTCMNLTREPREIATTEILGRNVSVELSSPMLHDCDLMITMPVPKVHVMTGVSLALKNQWGCLPDVKRLRNHPQFPYKILAINKLLRTRIALFDGAWFLDRSGPMAGDPIEMNLLVAADDPGAGSRVVCEIMGIDPRRIPHKRLALRAGMFPESLESIALNADPLSFKSRNFTLTRTTLNYLALVAFHSRLATWLIFNSVFAKPIHELLYLIRGRPKDVTPYW